jgi:hypothetical protein
MAGGTGRGLGYWNGLLFTTTTKECTLSWFGYSGRSWDKDNVVILGSSFSLRSSASCSTLANCWAASCVRLSAKGSRCILMPIPTQCSTAGVGCHCAFTNCSASSFDVLLRSRSTGLSPPPITVVQNAMFSWASGFLDNAHSVGRQVTMRTFCPLNGRSLDRLRYTRCGLMWRKDCACEPPDLAGVAHQQDPQ